ncbi:hypothetical protein LUW77_17990 [Streptomyces radiopugnans]|nr:hypothetical protein LUW77_17990 [Streptomyces radiopugnans]
MGAYEDRADALERAFGPLDDPANPLGREAILAADAAGRTLTGAEEVLDAHRFNAEFVPVELGGALSRMDGLGRVLRPVFRRDASLGFGYGLNCFFAAAPVWIGGSARQRAEVAGHLLEGRRVAVVRHEVAHGNDFVREEFTARPAAAWRVPARRQQAGDRQRLAGRRARRLRPHLRGRRRTQPLGAAAGPARTARGAADRPRPAFHQRDARHRVRRAAGHRLPGVKPGRWSAGSAAATSCPCAPRCSSGA